MQIEGLTSLASALYSIAEAQEPDRMQQLQEEQHAAESETTSSMGFTFFLPNPISGRFPAAGSVMTDGGRKAAQMLLPSSVSEPVFQAASFLQWLAAEVQALPPDERTQALLLPLQLVERVSSRIVARSIRGNVLTGVPTNN